MSRKTLTILGMVFIPVIFMTGLVTLESLAIHVTNLNFILPFSIGAAIVVLTSVGLFAISFYSSDSGHRETAATEQDSDGA